MYYSMGKLSQADYESLREEFQLLAVGAIQKVESLEKKKNKQKSAL